MAKQKRWAFTDEFKARTVLLVGDGLAPTRRRLLKVLERTGV